MGNQKISGKIEVRQMKADDITFIIDIDQKLTGIQRVLAQAEIVTADLGETNDLSLVAELDNRVIGFIIARQVYLGEPVVKTCAIQIIGVDPDYWRQRVGTKLLNSLSQRCNSMKIHTIRVVVSDKDSKMEGFFKDAGFKQAPLKVYNKVI